VFAAHRVGLTATVSGGIKWIRDALVANPAELAVAVAERTFRIRAGCVVVAEPLHLVLAATHQHQRRHRNHPPHGRPRVTTSSSSKQDFGSHRRVLFSPY